MKQPSVKVSYTSELDHVTDKKKILNASFSDKSRIPVMNSDRIASFCLLVNNAILFFFLIFLGCFSKKTQIFILIWVSFSGESRSIRSINNVNKHISDILLFIKFFI